MFTMKFVSIIEYSEYLTGGVGDRKQVFEKKSSKNIYLVKKQWVILQIRDHNLIFDKN